MLCMRVSLFFNAVNIRVHIAPVTGEDECGALV